MVTYNVYIYRDRTQEVTIFEIKYLPTTNIII